MLVELGRAAARRLNAHGTVLCFHSVTSAHLPGEGSAHISVDAFTSALRLASSLGELVPLSAFVRRRLNGRSTAGLVAVTFDDAYAALRTELRDFLSTHAAPIAIFAVTNHSLTGSAYWWDRLDDVFVRATPERWRAFEEACGLPEAYRAGQPHEYGPLRPLRQWLLARFAGRWPDRLEQHLDALERDAACRTVQRAMTFDELADMATIPGVEIGVHTVSHPVLPLLDTREMEHEIAGSFEILRERCPAALPVLAIPFGLYDERTLRAARSAGMMASLTLSGGLPDDRHFQDALPRLCITRMETRARLGLHVLGIPDRVRRWRPRELHYPALPSPTT